MTVFIQKWNTKTLPERIKKEICGYLNEDVIFIPKDTKQKFVIRGIIERDIQINKNIIGNDYHITPGNLLIGINLNVVLKE